MQEHNNASGKNISVGLSEGCAVLQVELAKKRKSLEERNEKRRAEGATEWVAKKRHAGGGAALTVRGAIP